MTTNNAKNVKARDIREGRALPELLCPAGSLRALEAAIEGGADAIYMGGVAFNARINAQNFTHEEMERGIALAHAYGAKVYIAANTLIYDRELGELLRAAESAYLCGADALIVADIGAAAEIRKRIPIELHASTQLSGHNSEAAHELEAAGFSRMVLAREMSAKDIRSFIDRSPLEAEVFVHGALCVCHSGQCLFSSMVGGRSGNRGECAQPCRLPYKTAQGKNAYPLSLKDLCLATHIPELCELGIASLKIEGRMKSPEYVRDVTRIWRRLLDARCAASPDDIKELEAVFSRGGFTDGYFTGKIDKSMLGVRSEEQKQTTRALEPFDGIKRRIPLKMNMTVVANKPVTLTVTRTDNGKTVSVSGAIPDLARTAPIDVETVHRSLSKLGQTAFAPEHIDVTLDGGLMLPVSSLNAIRRAAIEKLCEMEQRSEMMRVLEYDRPIGDRVSTRAAMFYEPANIPESAYEYFDIIYTPLEKYTGNTSGVALPPIIFDSERDKVIRMLDDARQKGAEHVLVANIGHMDIARASGLKLHADLRFNIGNTSTAAFLERLGFEDFIMSPELTLAQMRDIGGKGHACVYGRVPLMVTEKCVGKEIGDCNSCNTLRSVLTDRKGISFPVLRTFEHRSLIVNSMPFYMADKSYELDKNGIRMRFFIFTVEKKHEVSDIIDAYKKGILINDISKIKRIR